MICEGCKFAVWKTTPAGRPHPSGDGRCTYEFKPQPVPAAFYWVGRSKAPTPSGGFMNRREDRFTECPTREAVDAP